MKACVLTLLGLCLLSPCLAATSATTTQGRDAAACAEAVTGLIDADCSAEYESMDGSCSVKCEKALAAQIKAGIDTACYELLADPNGDFGSAADM